MNFPLTRHDQRYEYVLRNNWIKDRIVLDVGCGQNCYGSMMLSAEAKQVFGIDPRVAPDTNNIIWARASNTSHAEKVRIVPFSVEQFEVTVPTDNIVAVCIEIIEHVSDPKAFVKHVASLAKFAFYTTPLAQVTAQTNNPDHVVEYSGEDFLALLKPYYHIREYRFQTGDMRILKKAKPRGSSLDADHVVQMAWCERRS